MKRSTPADAPAGDTPRRGRQSRTSTSPTPKTRVLVSSGRRCCLCYGLNQDMHDKDGQIAHLDGNKRNNAPGNLAYLCLEHHNAFDSSTSQSKNYTITEVKCYRDALYRKIARTAQAVRPCSRAKAESPGTDAVQPKQAEFRLTGRVKVRGECSAVHPGREGSPEEHAMYNKIEGLPVQRDCSWEDLFWAVACAVGYGKSRVPRGRVRFAVLGLLEDIVDADIKENELYGSMHLTDGVVDMIALKLISLKLVTIRKDDKNVPNETWSLTDKGERYYGHLASNERHNLPRIHEPQWGMSYIW